MDLLSVLFFILDYFIGLKRKNLNFSIRKRPFVSVGVFSYDDLRLDCRWNEKFFKMIQLVKDYIETASDL